MQSQVTSIARVEAKEEVKVKEEAIDEVRNRRQRIPDRTTDQIRRPKDKYIDDCKFCGYSHEFGKCPAFGKKCATCKKVNHFANKC